MRVLWSLLPLVAFYVVESWWGLREAIVAGMVLALAELAWTRWAEGRWSRMAVGTAALVGVLGGLSLASDDPRFMLLSPAIGDGVFAALLAVATWRGSNLVVVALQEQEPDEALHPLQVRFLDGMSLRLAALLVAHAAMVVWSADRPRETWLFVTGPLQYLLLGAQMAFEVLWARLRVLPAVEAAEAAERDRHA